jgi:PERQ amino acid-rich with GYF domain-containing protein
MYEDVDEESNVAVSPIGETEGEAATAPAPASEIPQPAPVAPALAPAAPRIEPPTLTAPKAKVKSAVREAQAPTLVSAQKSTPPAPIPALKSPSPVPKPAWATEDDAKKGKASLGLREIQEAEAKKAEARKIAERERLARALVSTPPAVVDDAQPFTASWGLPTSQTGVRAAVTPRSGEAVATPAASAPVWTSTSTAPAKKTMKEIQEEEERRKKMGLKDSMAATAARRGYAETTFKVSAKPLRWQDCLLIFFGMLCR